MIVSLCEKWNQTWEDSHPVHDLAILCLVTEWISLFSASSNYITLLKKKDCFDKPDTNSSDPWPSLWGNAIGDDDLASSSLLWQSCSLCWQLIFISSNQTVHFLSSSRCDPTNFLSSGPLPQLLCGVGELRASSFAPRRKDASTFPSGV